MVMFSNAIKAELPYTMMNIKEYKPNTKMIQNHLHEFEEFCLGNTLLSPQKFRALNEELSIGAVLLVGKRRYQRTKSGTHLIWRGLDNKEHDMGLVDDIRTLKNYPGFHVKTSLSLGNDMVSDTQILPTHDGKKNVTQVTLRDGSIGIGPDYRIALRNAALKMCLKSKFNYLSLADVWKNVWGQA